MVPAPHGVICARLLPHVMEANVRALQTRAPESPALGRYAELAQLLTGQATATAANGVAWVQDLCAALQVPPLADYGFTAANIAAAVSKAQRSSSMKGNPIVLTEAELTAILRAEMRN